MSMPFNGSGTFTRLYSWVTDKANAVKITASRMDDEFDGIATALSNVLCRDGQSTVSANIPFNAKRITGLGDATAATDALNRQTADSRYLALPNPQGYLTPTSGTPVITSDVSAATAIYYTPFRGNLVPIYDGTTFAFKTFPELTLTLNSAHGANTIYDVYAFLSGGIVTIGTGPAWSASGSGAGSRGASADLTRVSGVLVNASSITCRNGSSTFSVSANQGTYLGSIFIDATQGQVTCHRSYGQSRKWGVWNAYNRVPLFLKGSVAAGANYTGTSWRPHNNDAANKVTVFCGLPQEIVEATYSHSISTAGDAGMIGVGWNSTTAPSGHIAQLSHGTAVSIRAHLTARHINEPFVGIVDVTALQNSGGGAGASFIAASTLGDNMALHAMWQG
jgi:hypothetical protein